MEFALDDLFVIGTALDLTGAWLLALGLLASPSKVALRTSDFLWSPAVNPYAVVEAAEDRITGTFGVLALSFGFGLQAAAYVVILACGQDSSTSTGRALTALALAVLVASGVLVTWLIARRALIKRRLVEAARWIVGTDMGPATCRPTPEVTRLATYGRVLEGQQRQGESDPDTVRRIFGPIEVHSDPNAY